MSKLFLTDYASYNNGTQFEFGHWVNLSEFRSADEFQTYVSDHLKEADEQSPLDCGSTREEPMYTDFEGLPDSLYSESMSAADLEQIFEYLALDERQQHAYEYLTNDQGYSHNNAISEADDVYMYEISHKGRQHTVWCIFEEIYPDAEQAEQSNPFLSIDYDRFTRDCLEEFTATDGTDYYILINN